MFFGLTLYKFDLIIQRMANYSIPDWAAERYSDIEDFIVSSMGIAVRTDKMKRLFIGNPIKMSYADDN